MTDSEDRQTTAAHEMRDLAGKRMSAEERVVPRAHYPHHEMLRLRVVGVIAMTSAIFVAFAVAVAPSGTDALTWLQRALYFGSIAAFGFPSCYSMATVVAYFLRSQTMLVSTLAVLVVAVANSVPVTAMVCVYPLWFNMGYAAPTFGTVFVTVLAPTATACLLMTYVIHQRIRDYRESGLLPVFPRFGGKMPDAIETGAASGAPKVSTAVSPRALSPSRPAPLAQVYQAGSTTPTLARKFLSRLPVDMDDEVIYIKTEGHYLRVFTNTGSSRLLMRFADAMAELSGLGMQVHRSYWVADDHIVGLVKRDNRTALLLTGDHVVPVSRTYLRSVRAATSK